MGTQNAGAVQGSATVTRPDGESLNEPAMIYHQCCMVTPAAKVSLDDD